MIIIIIQMKIYLSLF